MRLLSQKHYSHRPLTLGSSPPAGCCPIWRSTLSLLPTFSVSTSFSLGNGMSASFWSARWNGELSLRYLFPILYSTSPSKHLSVHNWLRRFASRPNLGFNSVSTPDGLRDLTLFRALVASISLSNNPGAIFWRWNNDGFFPVKSAYYFLCFDGVDDRIITHLWACGSL